MSDSDNTAINNENQDNQVNEADSKADAVAAFCLIMVAVGAMIYLVM